MNYVCTMVGDEHGEEWCATQTDQDHSVMKWGHCSLGCQNREDGGETNIKKYINIS